jgi:hypothetical protein
MKHKPITAKKLAEDILKILDNVVADFPPEEREEAKAKILGAFSQQMFSMSMKESE